MRCLACGNCCKQNNKMFLSDEEIRLIKNYIKETNFKSKNDYSICPFYDIETKRCHIQDIKPLICRIWYCDKHSTPNYILNEMKHRKLVIMWDLFE